MPIQQTRVIHCNLCGVVLKIETYGDLLDPLAFIRLFGPRKKQLCTRCKQHEKKRH